MRRVSDYSCRHHPRLRPHRLPIQGSRARRDFQTGIASAQDRQSLLPLCALWCRQGGGLPRARRNPTNVALDRGKPTGASRQPCPSRPRRRFPPRDALRELRRMRTRQHPDSAARPTRTTLPMGGRRRLRRAVERGNGAGYRRRSSRPLPTAAIRSDSVRLLR